MQPTNFFFFLASFFFLPFKKTSFWCLKKLVFGAKCVSLAFCRECSNGKFHSVYIHTYTCTYILVYIYIYMYYEVRNNCLQFKMWKLPINWLENIWNMYNFYTKKKYIQYIVSEGFKGGTRGSPIMPRDVSLSDSKCWNAGHEWVN